MFLRGIGAPELVIILVIVLVIFGPKKLPQLGKSIGDTLKAFRSSTKEDDDEELEESKSTEEKAEAKETEEVKS